MLRFVEAKGVWLAVLVRGGHSDRRGVGMGERRG